MKPHKIIDKIYYIIVISCVLFLAIIFFRDILSENRKISDEGESIMPDKQYQIDADTRKFEFSMQKIDNKERCIKFYTAHMEVRVYADNCLIYTIDKPKPFYEKTPGAVWNFVEIPSDTEKVTVILQAVYPEVRQKAINFYIGNLEQMYNKILYGSGLDIVVSLIEMAIGVILILYWSIAHSRLEIEHTILYFGIFSFMIGIWAFNESGTLMTIIPIRASVCPYFSGIAYADDAGICTVCEVFLESPGQMDFRCDLYTGIYQYSCPAYTSAYRNKGIQADVHSYTYFIGYGSDVYGRGNSLCNVEAWDKSAGDCR